MSPKFPALTCSVLLAATISPAWSMDLLQAWQSALEKDATILASRANTAARVERLPQAQGQLRPNISANLSRNRNELKSTQPGLFGAPSTSANDYYSAGQTLSLRQPLYRPYQTALVRQAEADVLDANAALLKDTQNVAVRVAGAYFDLLQSADQLSFVQAQKRAYTSQVDSAEKGFKAGTGTRTDIDEARSRLDMTVAQELEATENLDFTRRQLESVVGQPVGAVATLDATRMVLRPPEPLDLAAWLDRAEESSPDIQSLTAQVEVARQEVDKARAGHLPTLDLIAQRTRSQSENVTNFQSRYDNTSVGLQLAIPIYAGGSIESGVRQALANLDRAQQALDAGRKDLQLRVQREYRGVLEGVPKVRAQEQAARSTESLVNSTRKSFQAGVRTAVDILNAEQQNTQAKRDLAQARYLYLMSQVRLSALVGGVDETRLREINDWLVPAPAP